MFGGGGVVVMGFSWTLRFEGSQVLSWIFIETLHFWFLFKAIGVELTKLRED